MRLEVYSHALVQKYRTSLVTKAVIFQLILFVVLVIGPLLIAYRTSGFWIKEKYYTEKPYVYYRNEAIVFARTSQSSQPLFWSTYSDLNEAVMQQGSLATPLVKSLEVDNDYNGKNDYLDMEVMFPVNSGDMVTSVEAYIFFNYQLRLFSRVNTFGMALLQQQYDAGAHALSVSGDLNFVQKINLPHKGINEDFNSPIIDESNTNSAFNLNSLVKDYNARNLTTKFDYGYLGWEQGTSSDNMFTLKIHVNYPEQQVRYEPGFLEELKFAWIQYLSVFVIFLFAFDRLKTFVFQNQIFPTVPVADWKNRRQW